MGNKSNYGRAQQAPDAQKYAEGEFAAKRLAAKFKDMQMAIAYQKHNEQVQARQDALDFDYSRLPQHSALHVTKESGLAKLFIKIDIVHSRLTAKEVNFLTILPKYSPMIKDIEVHLIAPTYHESAEVYNLRVRNMIKTIDVLNTFDIENLEFVISMNRRDNFSQMKLGAACFGLNFDHWTMSTAVFGDKLKGFEVKVNSQTARRLAGVYKHEFLTQRVL